MPLAFRLDATDGPARAGTISTPHGVIESPVFMPVGTQATVKGLTPEMVKACGAQIILGNTYHLTLRPGDELIRDMGGLHPFMNWPGPILTDSGGYQVFSLAEQRKITDHGAQFKSHLDGSALELTPEKAVDIQQNLGSDIAMVLDECPPADGDPAVIRNAVRRSILWAERCKRHHTHPRQAQFAIVQGGLDVDLRAECAAALVPMDFPGYALGGFSVGEAPEKMHAALPACAALLPSAKPRYLMGVGRPEDLIIAVGAGLDMFDCVMPTRSGRNALAFTSSGPVRMRNARHRRDPAPLASDCACYCCANYSRAYLHHLFAADEMLGPTLLSLHNIAFYLDLMRQARLTMPPFKPALPGACHRSKMRVPILPLVRRTVSFHPFFAQTTPDGAGETTKTDKPAEGGKPVEGAVAPKGLFDGSNLMSFAPIILLALFFLVVLLPAQRRQKREAAERLAKMKPGAKVVLNSGIVGKIVTIKDGEDEIVIKSDDTKLRVLRSAVATVVDETAPTTTTEPAKS